MPLPRLPFRHVQLSGTGAAFPLLLRHGDLTKCRWHPDFCYVFYYSPAGACTRLFLSGARATTSAILPAWSHLDSDKTSSLLRPRPERLPGGSRASHAGRPLQLRAHSRRKVAVVSASSSTCWLEFFGRRSFFSAPPATAVHRLLNLRVDVGLEPVEPAPQVLLPLVRLHIGLLASCQFHPAEAISHWLTLPRGGLGF